MLAVSPSVVAYTFGVNMALTLVEQALIRPSGLNGGTNDYSADDLRYVVSQFQVDLPIYLDDFPEKGNINLHTYALETATGKQFLLQKVNSSVFTRPARVMDSMGACLDAQRRNLEAGAFWEPIELVPTRDGKSNFAISDEHGWSVWRLMHRIQRVVSFKSLAEVPADRRMFVAEQVGAGLAQFGDLTADMPVDLPSPLPGYRRTDIYFRQLDAALDDLRDPLEAAPYMPETEELREACGPHFFVKASPEVAAERQERARPWINFLQEHRPQAMRLYEALSAGKVRRTMIHGDTKIENFLFCQETLRVKALVDLDTIVSSTWLADYGDMVRSLVNVAGEKEPDLDRVQVNTEVYDAVQRGFLSAAPGITDAERALMHDAVISITMELGTRFLTDYLRGDTYFGVPASDPELNLTRAAVQLTLADRLMQIKK